MDDFLDRILRIEKEEYKQWQERRKIWEKSNSEFWASVTPQKAQTWLDDMESNPNKYRGMSLEIAFQQVVRYPMSIVLFKRILKELIDKSKKI